MAITGYNLAVLSLFLGFFTALIGHWYNQRLQRQNLIYSERRQVYSKFLRAWWAVIHTDNMTEELNIEYTHAKSLFAMHATPKALDAFNSVTKFIVTNNYLSNDFDQLAYLDLLGQFLVQLRKDAGEKKMSPEKILGLTYIKLSDLEKNGVIARW